MCRCVDIEAGRALCLGSISIGTFTQLLLLLLQPLLKYAQDKGFEDDCFGEDY